MSNSTSKAFSHYIHAASNALLWHCNLWLNTLPHGNASHVALALLGPPGHAAWLTVLPDGNASHTMEIAPLYSKANHIPMATSPSSMEAQAIWCG